MKCVRIGIVGIGVMGMGHAKYILSDSVEGASLTAVCDIDKDKLTSFSKLYGDKIKCFDNYTDMLKSGVIDAVLIATPHYSHPEITIKSFEMGYHVLVEKPAGVYAKEVEKMNAAHKKSGKVFSIDYCQRTEPAFIKMRDIIKSGELGEIKRVNWTVTTWYRPQSYHDSSSWRSTWADEGGGLLINQCPHNLDLWQWMLGMPDKIYSEIGFGKYYDIEVEDDVTAILKYKNGMTGVFIASTGETPGTNRIEIAADMGKLVYENEELTFYRNRVSEREFNKTFTGMFGTPEVWECKIPIKGEPMSAKHITANFVRAILHGEELIAPGEDGINGLLMSNAMHLSAWTGKEVSMPPNNDLFYNMLLEKIKESEVRAV